MLIFFRSSEVPLADFLQSDVGRTLLLLALSAAALGVLWVLIPAKRPVRLAVNCCAALAVLLLLLFIRLHGLKNDSQIWLLILLDDLAVFTVVSWIGDGIACLRKKAMSS